MTFLYFVFFVASVNIAFGVLLSPSFFNIPNSNCSLRPADIVFLLDSSGSEGHTHFNEQLQFVKHFVNAFDIGPQNVQIGVVTFASHPANRFNLNTYTNKKNTLNAIDKIPYTTGLTNTYEALLYALQHSFTAQAGDRPSVTDVMIVITDGKSVNRLETIKAANMVHKAGLKTFAIGIGDSISLGELGHIASDAYHVFNVSSFDSLHFLQNELLDRTCKALALSNIFCHNGVSNCNAYSHSMCVTYAKWGRENCALYCGYCSGQGTPAPISSTTTIKTTMTTATPVPSTTTTVAPVVCDTCVDYFTSQCHNSQVPCNGVCMIQKNDTRVVMKCTESVSCQYQKISDPLHSDVNTTCCSDNGCVLHTLGKLVQDHRNTGTSGLSGTLQLFG